MPELTDFELNCDWTRDPANREKFQGQWVVLRRGKLLAYGDNYSELYQKYGELSNWILKVK